MKRIELGKTEVNLLNPPGAGDIIVDGGKTYRLVMEDYGWTARSLDGTMEAHPEIRELSTMMELCWTINGTL